MFTTKHAVRGECRGATLAEYMVGLGVSGIVLTAVVALSLYYAHSFASMANYTDMNADSTRALDRMTSEIRKADYLLSYDPQQLVFHDGPGKPPLVFAYQPDRRTVLRVQGAETNVLLSDCDSLRFTIFQRTPKAGTYDQYPVAVVTNCKVVQVEWSSSRSLLAAKANTEEVQSAKIVLRRH